MFESIIYSFDQWNFGVRMVAHKSELAALFMTALLLGGPVILSLCADQAEGEETRPEETSSHVIDQLDIRVRYQMEKIIRDGYILNKIYFADGGIERGEEGQEVPFSLHSFDIDSKITDYKLDFKEPDMIEVDQIPWMVPSVIGEKNHIDPDWEGQFDHPKFPEYSLQLIGKDEEGYHYSLRTYPVVHMNGRDYVFTRILLNIEVDSWFETYSEEPNSNKPVGQIKYLVITDTDLVDAVMPLAEWKTEKGLFSRVVTVDEIDRTYETGDKASKMRRYIQDMEMENDLDYLLLAGDYDKVPTRLTHNQNPAMMYGEPSNFATDGYFSCVSQGSTWNSDGDSKYAEPSELDDPYPDLSVGRIAINNATTMSLKINELIEREKKLNHDSEDLISVSFAGDNKQVPGESTDVMDHFWETYLENDLDGRETLYYDGSGTISFSPEGFRSILKENHQVYGYFSHGQFDAIPELFSRNDVPSLNDSGADGMFFAMACLTGWFDRPIGGQMTSQGDCFAEAMTETPNKGVVAYFGASRLALGSSDTDYSGDAPGLEEDYYRSIERAFNNDIPRTMGWIYRDAVTHFSTSFYPFPNNQQDAGLRTFLEYNMLGEPDAPLIFQDPGQLEMTYELDMERRIVKATIVDENGDPVEDAGVSVSIYGELGVKGYTDGNGEVTISIPASNGGEATICAYKQDHIHDNGTFILEDELAPLALHSIYPEEPDGKNGFYVTRPSILIFGNEPVTVEYWFGDNDPLSIQEGIEISTVEGDNLLNFQVRDRAGHTSEIVSLDIRVDSIPPELGIDVTPFFPTSDDIVYQEIPEVILLSQEELFEPMYSIDGGYWVRYSDPVKIDEGTHLIEFRSKDVAGNQAMANISLNVDTTPAATILHISHDPDGENGYYVTRPNVKLSSDSEDVSFIEFRWNDDEWTRYEGPMSPPEGESLLKFRSVDLAGNIELDSIWPFKVDTVYPDVDMKIYPDEPDGSNGYYITEPEVGLSSKDDMSYFISYKGYPAVWEESISYDGAFSIDDGQWTLHVKSRDIAGNELIFDPVDIKVDTTDPELSVSITPSQPNGNNDYYTVSPKMDITSTIAGVDHYYRIDGGKWMKIDGQLMPGEGISSIEFRAVDIAGNQLISDVMTVKVDTTMPVIGNISIEEGDVIGPGDLSVSWTVFEEISSVMNRVKLDDRSIINLIDVSLYTFGELGEGPHRILIESEDEAGNVASRVVNFEVDSVAPSIMSINPGDNPVPVNAIFTVEFSEQMDRDSVSVSMDGLELDLHWDGSLLKIDPVMELDYSMIYNISLSGKDLHGNEMEDNSFEIRTVVIVIQDVEPPQKEESNGWMLPVILVAVSFVIGAGISFAVIKLKKGTDHE